MFCAHCGELLEDTEFGLCADCADSDDDWEDEDEADFFENRFDMETEQEYKIRSGERWSS